MSFSYNLLRRIVPLLQSVDKPLCFLKMGCRALLALLVLHRAKLLASNQSVLALGVAPRQVAGTPVPVFSPARMPGVYAQRLYARTHTSGRTKSVQDAPTTNDHDCTDAEPTKHTQPFTGKGGRGIGLENQHFI